MDKALSIATSRGRKLVDEANEAELGQRKRFRGPGKEVLLGRGLAGKPRGRKNHLRKYSEHSWTWTSQSAKAPLYLDFAVLEDTRSRGQILPPQLRRALSGGAGEK